MSPPDAGGLRNHPWPVFGRDPQGTRRSPADTSGNTGKILWRLALGTLQPDSSDTQLSSPVIAKDGTVYVHSADHILYAVAPPTAEKGAALMWSYTVPHEPAVVYWACSPALGDDGTVYVTSADTVYAVSAPSVGDKGELKWRYASTEPFGDYLGTPTVGRDGTIYAVGIGLIALDENGLLKWSSTVSGGTMDPPAIANDGTVYYGPNDLKAVRPPSRGTNGTLAWSSPGAALTTSPTVAPDGTVYVGSYDQLVRAIAPAADGTSAEVKWSYHTDSMDHTAPAIGPDGTVYVAAGVYGVFAFNPNAAGPNGELKWRWYHNDNQWWSRWPAVGADGTIYVVGTNNVHAVSPPKSGTEGVLKWVLPLGGNQVSAPAIGADGTIYVTANNTLYAIQ